MLANRVPPCVFYRRARTGLPLELDTPKVVEHLFSPTRFYVYAYICVLPCRARPMPLPRQSSVFPPWRGICLEARVRRRTTAQSTPRSSARRLYARPAEKQRLLYYRLLKVRTVTGFDPSSTRFPTVRTENILYRSPET